MQASLKLTCFRRCCPCEVGRNFGTSWRLQVTHTHTHVSNVHPTHCSPRHTSQGHLASCCANVLLTWATLGAELESPGRRLWNMLKANLLKFLRVAFFNVLSWTCRLALWNPRTYCWTVLCVCAQPIIVSIQLHAHNTHNHEHPPSSPLGISVQYLWQLFGWNKTGQKWSKHLRTSSLPLRTFWDPSRLQELHVGGRQGIAALRRVRRLGWVEGLTRCTYFLNAQKWSEKMVVGWTIGGSIVGSPAKANVLSLGWSDLLKSQFHLLWSRFTPKNLRSRICWACAAWSPIWPFGWVSSS